MMRLLAAFLAFFIFANVGFAQAASEEFNIRVYGGVDSTPPTTPTLLSASPIGPTQIDINWSSSTDNFVVSGYSVFRGSTTIATTTLTSYSDTGLSASTTYSYSVRAFDVAINYSSTSNTISTTTPDYPVTPTPTSTSYESTAARVVLDELSISTETNLARLKIETVRPAKIELRWGRTGSYELGYIVRDSLAKINSVLITDLEPGTVYEYELIGYTPFGVQTILKNGKFVTKELAPSQPLSNVKRFMATADGLGVELTWKLPEVENLSHIRIVRSHLNFPRYPQDGAIIYQGLRESFTDRDILAQYSPVYYTAFVYDSEGNVSSGAVAMAFSFGSEILDAGDGGFSEAVPGSVGGSPLLSEPSSDIFTDRLAEDMRMPSLSEIYITQDDSRFSLFDSDISLSEERGFVVSIDSEYVTGNLKSIIFTVVDPTDTRVRHSYLLRINKNQSAYVGTIPPLGVIGQSWGLVDIYDYQSYIVSSYQAPIFFEYKESKKVVFPDVLFENLSLFTLISLFLVSLFFVLLLAFWLRTEDKR